jgi:uncharacterized protein YehS (DUF1456 family)
MQNNEVLKRLRYALNIPDFKVVEMLKAVGYEIPKRELEGIFKSEGETEWVECDDARMRTFLDALVVEQRGMREEGDAGKPHDLSRVRLSNNDILKRIRVALAMKDEDIVAIMQLAGAAASKSELSALFRKKGHPNYRPCGDQFLRSFLVGLTAKYRG